MEELHDLRQQARQKLSQQPAPDLSDLSVNDAASLVEELYIHQAELEIQNENLRQIQQDLEISRQRYKTLYDFAPIGYFTFDHHGHILEVNITGAAQLGLSQSDLRNQPFTAYIAAVSQDIFYLHRQLVFDSKTKQSCELQIVRPDGYSFEAYLESIAVPVEAGPAGQFLGALLDITERADLENALQTERNLLKTVIDQLPTYTYIKDRNSRFIMANTALAQAIGVQASEALIGKTDFDFFPEPLARQYYSDEQALILSQQPLINKTEAFIDATGRSRWLSTTKVPLHDGDGKIIGLAGISQDLTEEYLATQRMKLLHTITQYISEADRFDVALSDTLDTIGQLTRWDYGEAWLLDEETQMMKCTPAWYGNREKLGHFRAQSENLMFPKDVGLQGHVWVRKTWEWIPDISAATDNQLVRRQLALDAGLKAALATPFLANHRIVVVLIFFMCETSPADEEMINLIWTVTSQLGLVLHRKKVQDEREQLLQAVHRQREEMRSLAGRLTDIREVERRQLAQELHDQVGQNMTALGFNLDAIEAQLSDISTENSMIETQLDDSFHLIEEMTNFIRNIVADLRPPMLEETGLNDALEWYAEQFALRTGLPVVFQDGNPGRRLGNSVETALFRISQEALINIGKHAKATQVTITINKEEDKVYLIIADDGVGFDPAEVAADKQRHSLGLLTMQERALAVNGQWRIESQPGQGTKVIVEVSR